MALEVAPASGLQRRLWDVLADVESLAAELGFEDLPEFFAGLERARWTAQLRLQTATTHRPDALHPLLTVEKVARLLGISEGQVYRLAKGPLRSAAVDIGECTLRFDYQRVLRFIDGRRRG